MMFKNKTTFVHCSVGFDEKPGVSSSVKARKNKPGNTMDTQSLSIQGISTGFFYMPSRTQKTIDLSETQTFSDAREEGRAHVFYTEPDNKYFGFAENKLNLYYESSYRQYGNK